MGEMEGIFMSGSGDKSLIQTKRRWDKKDTGKIGNGQNKAFSKLIFCLFS